MFSCIFTRMKKYPIRIAGCLLAAAVCSGWLFSCSGPPRRLPFLGNTEAAGQDSGYPRIADFAFVDQSGKTVTNQTLSGKIYVADFIFLSCPTICPKMTAQLQKVYAAYQSEPGVVFLSHTIDPERDSLTRLRQYASSLGADPDKWHFLRGNADTVMYLAEHSYFSAAYPDSTSPGGFTHSGGLLLIDKNRYIRGVYNGTDPAETKRLIDDISLLLKE